MSQSDSALSHGIDIDESMMALSRELSALAAAQVSQAAKERGWASLRRELERRPVRAGGRAMGAPVGTAKGAARQTGPARPTRSRSWRWALASAAAAVAVIATLLGTYGGGLLQTADNDDHPTTITSVVSPDSTDSSTTASSAPSTTIDASGPGSTGGAQPDTTQGPGTNTTGTTLNVPGTTQPANSTTTQPSSPTTTGEQQNAARQREGSAKAAAIYLANLVITGNSSGAGALVAPGAQSSLVQMIRSLHEPYGYTDVSAQSLAGDSVRVTLSINDRILDGQGQLVETLKRFVIQVRVDEAGAVITAISAGS